MIRTGLMKIVMWTIIPIAFTLIFFVTVDYKQSEPWISLVFVWLAYLTASVSCLSNIGNRHAILNYTLTLCAIGYILIELLAAIAFLYFYTDIPRWAFTIQFLLLVVYVLLFGFVYISNLKTGQQMCEFRVNESRVKQWRAKIALIQSNNPSMDIRKLSDLLKITPTTSSPEVSSIDDEITTMIESEKLNISQIIKKLEERNIILKH